MQEFRVPFDPKDPNSSLGLALDIYLHDLPDFPSDIRDGFYQKICEVYGAEMVGDMLIHCSNGNCLSRSSL